MKLSTIAALAREVAPLVQSAFADAVKPILVRLHAVESRSPEKGERGEKGDPGVDGKDGSAGRDGVDGKDGTPGERGPVGEKGESGIDGKDGAPGRDGDDGKEGPQGPQGERGLDGNDGEPGQQGDPGLDGKDGRDGLDGKDGAPGERGPVGEKGADGLDGKDGRDGIDGKSVDPTEIERMVSDAVRSVAENLIPKSFMVNEAGALVAAYADGNIVPIGKVRGEDGARGASIMDGSVDDEGALILRMSDGRHVNVGRVRGDKGIDGLPGAPGRAGRDAHEIAILPGIEESKSYLPDTCARWRGGLIRSDRQTDPVVDGNIRAAGWSVILNGVAEETEHDLDDGRVVERETRYTDGTVFRRTQQKHAIIYRGVWKEGSYQRGDAVTWAGSLFIAHENTTQKPETGKDWQLAAKRGRDGRNGENGRAGPQGPEGKPGRVY